MSGTETKDDIDLPKETETKKPHIDITTEEGRDTLFQMRCIAMGIDPKQVQSIAKFIDHDDQDQGSYFPNQTTSLAIAQLRGYGKAHYRGHEWNPYDVIADCISIGFKGYKGFKSGQYVEITSGQPNLEKLQGLPDETKKGILSGILGRSGKAE